MRFRSAAREQPGDFAFRADEFVVAAGEIVQFEKESEIDPGRVDHFWITIRAGNFGLLRVSISTWSMKHAADGFDPRMRVAVVPSSWTKLPVSGIRPALFLNYAEIEKANRVVYREFERPELEELLSRKSRGAFFAEAWGALYLRDRLGIHQVHSRRASCSVKTDYVGRDGAIRFYFREESRTEMLLFKYCGQV